MHYDMYVAVIIEQASRAVRTACQVGLQTGVSRASRAEPSHSRVSSFFLLNNRVSSWCLLYSSFSFRIEWSLKIIECEICVRNESSSRCYRIFK